MKVVPTAAIQTSWHSLLVSPQKSTFLLAEMLKRIRNSVLILKTNPNHKDVLLILLEWSQRFFELPGKHFIVQI